MTGKYSRIDIRDIFKEHLNSLKVEIKIPNKSEKLIQFPPSVINIFIIYPLVISFLISFFFGNLQGNSFELVGISLSVFIGLLLNVLVLIISVANTQNANKDPEVRKCLVRSTFYNISYTIAISIIALLLLFVFQIKFNIDENVKIIDLYFRTLPLNVPSIIMIFFSTIYYAVLINIILTLFMILKRIFSLFRNDLP